MNGSIDENILDSFIKKIDIQENIQNCSKKVTDILKAYGAKTIVRGGKFKTLEGEYCPRTVIY